MEIIFQNIAPLFPVIFSANLIMAAVKFLAAESATKPFLRTVLAGIAIFGAIATAAITGDPVNMDSITSLLRIAADAAIVAIGSHYSYVAIKST